MPGQWDLIASRQLAAVLMQAAYAFPHYGGAATKLQRYRKTAANGQISAQALPRLFEPYSRPAKDTPQAGLGLGLYIVKQIADAHGGELSISTTAEHGTEFTFRLPTA